jgi:hydrogenase maturation protein HypF
MAEHGLSGPVIGVTFDGTGYGPDGAIWGGEFLTGGYADFRRAGHLRYVGMPGGDKAVHEPWRMALAHSLDAGCKDLHLSGVTDTEKRVVRRMLERGLNCQLTSSMGRLFDAVAAIAGVRSRVGYEGQAAVELESLATVVSPDGSYPFEIAHEREANQQITVQILDTRQLIQAVITDVATRTEPRFIARRFHSTVVEMIACACDKIRAELDLDTVVLSGGVFLNALLTSEASVRLERDGFRVYRHRLVPPNDGGLALGQLAIAAAVEK